MRKKILIAGLIGLGIGLLGALVYATTTDWNFTTPTDYTVSDANKVEVAGGVAK